MDERNPHHVTEVFERRIADYTGAPYAVAANSCTMAILLACAWHVQWPPRAFGDASIRRRLHPFSLPRPGYISVPQSIIHAGGRIVFRDEEWSGAYQLAPYPVWDCARRFTSGMYRKGQHMCVSFHASKVLGLEQGGAILHDDPVADEWYRRARFDGRTPGVHPRQDSFDMIGWHCYMNPSTAAQGLLRMHSLPLHNADVPNDDYPDLSTLPCFFPWRDDVN